MIPSAQQEACVVGKIILKKSAMQSDKLIRLGEKPMSVTLGASMTMQSVIQKENT